MTEVPSQILHGRGYVGKDQPHWWQHRVTLLDAPDLADFGVTLFPAYGYWRGKAHWTDGVGQPQERALTDVQTTMEPDPDHPDQACLWLTFTIALD